MDVGERRQLRIVKKSAGVDRSARPSIRRFPPVVQVLTMTAPHLQQRLQDIAMIGFRDGDDIDTICGELHGYAHSLGYDVTIGIQDVSTSEMPSFPGITVKSTLLLVDLAVASRLLDPPTSSGDASC